MKFLISLLLISSIASGQHQERKLFLYNVGFGGFTSAVGSVINKPKQAKWKHYFLKGFCQGALGGLLHYSGKKTLYEVNKKEALIYAWSAKLLESAGSSIIENAALNEPFLKNWSVDFGPARLDFFLSQGKKPKVRFLPFSIYSIVAGIRTAKFDLTTTLLTGNLAFKSTRNFLNQSRGLSHGRSFSYLNDSGKYHYIAHELIHQYQFSEYQIFNTWLQPLISKIKSDKIKSVFEKHIYLDIPYFYAFYGIEGTHSLPEYYRNFYEFEAERFSTNAYVRIN